MTVFSRHRLIGIWLLLLAATLATGLLGIQTQMGTLVSAGAMLAISFAKAFAVMSEFMELRRAPTVWRVLPALWLLAVLMIIFAGYASAHLAAH